MQTFTIGRDASNQIVLNDNQVSRRHAQITLSDNGHVMIKDLGSVNGTFVNGKRINESPLNPGDVVKCGPVFLNWAQYANSNLKSNFSQEYHGYNNPSYQRNQFSFSTESISAGKLKHEKENTYFIIRAVFSSLFWAALLGLVVFYVSNVPGSFVFLLSIILPGLLFLTLVSWVTSLFFKAGIYGHSVKVNANQYPEIYRIASIFSQRLGLAKIPDIFICNQDGLINSLAIKFFSRKYVMLYSNLVDLMLSSGKNDELAMFIGHGLGHHAAGHTNFWKNLFLKPSHIIPFLTAAHHRACVLTADRIGFALTNNLISAQNALVALALGSERLSQTSNINEFMQQEHDIPGFMGFINKIFSSHPRTTRRVIEITSFGTRQII